MAIRKIDTRNLVIERTFDKKQPTRRKINSVRVNVVSKEGRSNVSNKELVMKKMSEIGNVIRQNENFNLSSQDKNAIWEIIATR